MNDVVIYTTPYCPFCWRAKGLLEKKSVDYDEIDVSTDPEARRRMMERAVTDLPQPLSPTTPSVLSGAMAKLTPSTARAIPSSVSK